MQYNRLSLKDKEQYQHYWESCPEKTADYIFTNLFAWDSHYDFELAFEEELVFIKTKFCHRAPIGDWTKVDFTKIPFFQEKITLRHVPEMLKDILEKQFDGKIEIEEDLASAEYLYNQEDLANLKGNRFHKKKNHVNNYVKYYGVDYRPFDKTNLSQEEKEELIALCEDWFIKNNAENNDTLKGELEGIKSILNNLETFTNIKGGRLYYNDEDHEKKDKLLAFSLGEKLDSQTFVVHFEKANTEYRAVFQAINKFFAQEEAHEFALINREQDLGDEGLRKAKMSYHPVDFLKKFTVTVNP